MAKKEAEAEVETAEAQSNTTTSDTAANVEEPRVDERFKMITDPETKEPVKRKDYILKLWTEKRMSRGDIARHLTELTGKKVPYQIVFASTKGIDGGPLKTEGAASGGAEAQPAS